MYLQGERGDWHVGTTGLYDNGWSLAVDNDDDDDGWVYLR